ncbi:hypothetical protein D3C87_377390 [compost metagenome]
MKNFLIASFLLMGSLAQAESLFKGQHVYDSVLQTAMYIEDINGRTYYVRHFRGDEMLYPRYADDLSPRVKSAGKISEGMDVSFYNRSTRRWYYDEVKYVFANGVAYFDGALGKYAVGQSYLGIGVSKLPNSNLKAGSTACTVNRTTHLRKGGEKGTVVKLYENGSAKMKFKDFFVVPAYEVVPLDNLRVCR